MLIREFELLVPFLIVYLGKIWHPQGFNPLSIKWLESYNLSDGLMGLFCKLMAPLVVPSLECGLTEVLLLR